MTTTSDIYKRYLKVSQQVHGDEELTLKALAKIFGGADNLWHVVHNHITNLENEGEYVNDSDDLAEMLDSIDCLERAVQEVITETIEQEFLTDRINTITRSENGYKLFLESGREVEISLMEIKTKVVLINNTFAFDHFKGLVESDDVLEVFKIVDLFYVD